MEIAKPLEVGWVYRPASTPACMAGLSEHAGKRVHSVGTRPAEDGRVEVVLADGQRVWAHRHELVTE